MNIINRLKLTNWQRKNPKLGMPCPLCKDGKLRGFNERVNGIMCLNVRWECSNDKCEFNGDQEDRAVNSKG